MCLLNYASCFADFFFYGRRYIVSFAFACNTFIKQETGVTVWNKSTGISGDAGDLLLSGNKLDSKMIFGWGWDTW